MSPPENASGPAGSEAGAQESKITKTVTSRAAGGKPLLDVTEKSSKMPRNSALLFPNQAPRSCADWAHYPGILRMFDGRFYWAGIWQRVYNGRLVLELRLEFKEEPAKPLRSPAPSQEQQFLEAFHTVARGVLDSETFKALGELPRHSGVKEGG